MKYAFLSLFFLTSVSAATVAEEKKIFRMCYAQIIKERVPVNHPSLAAIQNGMKGSDACIKLVQDIQLDGNGQIPMLPGNKIDWKKQRVLQTIIDIHHSTFAQIHNLQRVFSNEASYAVTAKVLDEVEMALHFVYPFVKSGVPFSSALTNNHALEAVRYSEANSKFPDNFFFNMRRSGSRDYGNGRVRMHKTAELGQVQGAMVGQGLIVGLKPAPARTEMYLSSGTSRFTHSDGHFGGGAMGTNAFIQLTEVDGYAGGPTTQQGVFVNMPRNFAISVMREFLCRDLPVLRPSDVTANVNLDSPVSFHQSSQCLACHMTIEPLVYTRKNYYKENATIFTDKPNTSALTANVLAKKRPGTSDTSDGSLLLVDGGNHSSGRPIGYLRMRSAINGEMIEEQVEDISGLAAAIAQTDDFYACSVKRYVQYFTGLQTQLFDPGDSEYSYWDTPADRQLRAFIFSLAAELKQHQDPKLVWKRIFNNKIFLNPQQGEFGEVN